MDCMRRHLCISKDVIPVGKLKVEVSQWMERIKKTKQHLVITKNGVAAGVLMSPNEYDYMRQQQELAEAVLASTEDIKAGRTYTSEELRKRAAKRRAKRKQK